MKRVVVLLAALGVAALAQDTRREKTPEAAVEHLLGPSPTVRKQALAWSREHLEEVAPLVAGALGDESAAAIPFDAIRSLGELKHDAISAALVELAGRADFPWKPHAVEALADHAFQGAVGVFARSIGSPVARSRAAACRGVGAIGFEQMESLVAKCLGDEEAGVRLEAARTLLGFGDASGIAVVIRDLSLDRRFMSFDPGAEARQAAAAFLRDTVGVAPEEIPAGVASAADLQAVLAAARRKLSAVPGLAESVQPHGPDVADSLTYAVEVRSCQEGDWFTRFDEHGNVVLGRDLLRRYKVEPEVVAPIVDALETMDTGGPRRRRIVGPVTCDFERFGIRDAEGWRTLVLGTGRRDASFDALEKAMIALIAQTRGPGFAEAHRRRVAPFGEAGGGATSAPATRPR